jgi:hypothetical protein
MTEQVLGDLHIDATKPEQLGEAMTERHPILLFTPIRSRAGRMCRLRII